ncbi:MAG: DUF3015 family protein [Bdellovibrio sp.]
MKSLLAILTIIGAASVASAGDAGCGLGSMILKSNSKLQQVLAATTNGTFGSQTFGITSGTSNCSASSLVMNEKEIQYFAEANQTDLTREMAQGNGEKLSTLAALYGCNGNQKANFAKMTQSSYSKIVDHKNISATQMVQNLNTQVASSNVCVASNN